MFVFLKFYVTRTNFTGIAQKSKTKTDISSVKLLDSSIIIDYTIKLYQYLALFPFLTVIMTKIGTL